MRAPRLRALRRRRKLALDTLRPRLLLAARGSMMLMCLQAKGRAEAPLGAELYMAHHLRVEGFWAGAGCYAPVCQRPLPARQPCHVWLGRGRTAASTVHVVLPLLKRV